MCISIHFQPEIALFRLKRPPKNVFNWCFSFCIFIDAFTRLLLHTFCYSDNVFIVLFRRLMYFLDQAFYAPNGRNEIECFYYIISYYVLSFIINSFEFLSQNLRNQIMTTNVWVEQVSDIQSYLLKLNKKIGI